MIAVLSPGSGVLDRAAARASFLGSFLLLLLVSFDLGMTGAFVVGTTEDIAADVGRAAVLAGVPAGCAGAFAVLPLGKAAGGFAAEAVGEMAAESVAPVGV